MFTPAHVSDVRCQVSGVRCQVSGVRYHVAGLTFKIILNLFIRTKWWCQLMEGLLSRGPTPSSFLYHNFVSFHIFLFFFKSRFFFLFFWQQFFSFYYYSFLLLSQLHIFLFFFIQFSYLNFFSPSTQFLFCNNLFSELILIAKYLFSQYFLPNN